MGDRYTSLGASATKAGLHRALDEAGLSSDDRYFAKLSTDSAGDPAYASFVHCDGAGTKSIVAYLLYRETGDVNVFGGLAQDALVMNLDDIYCLGTPERLTCANAIARNVRLIPDGAISALVRRYRELTSEMNAHGVPLELAGGETADCGDLVRTLLVDAVVTGRIKRDALVDCSRISAGDVIVGFSSTGQASYEKSQNSGIGSNGLTLARHALLNRAHSESYPEIADPQLDKSLIYRGPLKVTEQLSDLGMSLGEALLSPTRTYAPILSKIYQTLPNAVHGAIHVTGGGLSKVLRFGRGNLYVKDQLFDTPPLFRLIQRHGDVSWKEMYQVFNMGHRMELYLPAEHLNQVCDIAGAFGVAAKQIGQVERNSVADRNKVVVRAPTGEFEYELS